MAWETVEVQSRAPNEVLAQSTASVFISRVYRWMFGGLFLTAATALWTASTPAALNLVIQHPYGLMFAQFGAVIGLSGLANRISGAATAALFLAYSALTGLTFSVLFLLFTPASIVQVFAITAGVYGAMSLYGALTKKDLSAWGTFLFMGLIGVMLASVVQIFVHSDMLRFTLSCAGVVVFAGMTAYDNQMLRAMHASSGYSSALSLTIVGALRLYLDFINLFISLLQLFGRRR
jgi:FtsH-binding integral membrane protein